MTCDLNWITEDVAVGGAVMEAAIPWLARDCGIHRVVDVRAETVADEELLRQHGIELLRLPTPDFHPLTTATIDHGVQWIGDAVADGEKVLVHCQLGIGRSVSLVCCYLIACGLKAPEAMLKIKDARPVASPCQEQIEAVLRWEEERFGRSHNWMDMARIAYRHLDHWKNAQ